MAKLVVGAVVLLQLLHSCTAMGGVPPTITDITGEEVYYFGGDALLTCEAMGTPVLNYAWIFNDTVNITELAMSDVATINMAAIELGPVLNVTDIDASDGGLYYCVVINNYGYDFDGVTVYVAPYFVDQPDAVVNALLNTNIVLSCAAEAFPEPQYHWMTDDTYLAENGSELYIYVSPDTFVGQYSCEVFIEVDSEEFSISRTFYLTVSPEGSGRIEQSTFLAYPGDNVTFECIADGGPNNTFIWLFDAADEFCIACSDPQPDNVTSYIEYVLSSSMTVTVVDIEPLLEIMSVNASYGGSYQCVVFNNAGFEIVDTNLSVAPLFTVQPQSINREVNEYANFTCEAVSFPDPYYQWQRYMDGQFEDIPDANTSILIFLVDFDSYGMYRCVASIPGAVEYSDAALLTVSPRGSVLIMPPVVLEVGGGVATFNCTADGGPYNMFEWLFMDIVVFTGPMYTVYANETTFGDYTCQVSNDAGSDSDTSTLFLSPEGFVHIEPSALVANPGDNVSFECIADAGPNNTFTWLFDAADQFCIACSDPQPDNATSYIEYVLSSSMTVTVVGTEPLLEIMSVNASYGGSYQCVVFNNAGFEIVDTSLSVAPLFIVQPQSINREVDEYTNFTCEAVSFPDPYYQWQRYMDGQFEDIPDANTSVLIFAVDFDSYGMYRCVASIPGAVEYSDAALLTVSPRGSVLIMPPVVLEVGGGVATFNCTADGGPYNMFEWLFMDIVVFTGPMYTVYANETTFGDYTCQVSNDAGSGSDTSTLFLSPEGFVRIEQSTFLAYPGDNVSFECIADAGPNNTFTWLFDAADQFCIACSNPQPDNATSYIEYVLSSSMTVTVVGTEPLLEIMSVNASYGGSYQCVVFNDAGFEIVDTNLSVAPLFIVQPQSINREVDEYTNFTCEAVSFPDPYYQWQRYMDGQFEDIPDANTSMLIFLVDFDSYGMYRCVASIPGAVEYSDAALLTVSPRGSVLIMPPVVLEVGGGVATFNCTADGGPYNMFEWLFMDIVVFTGPMYTVYANETTFGDYTCRVSNDAGSGSDTSTLFLSPEGFVRIEQSTFLAYPGETVTFQCIADAGPNNTFTWLFDAADQFCIACSDPQPDNATSYIEYVLSSSMTVTVVGTEPLLEIMSVNASYGGSYQCVVFNNAGFEIVDTNLSVAPLFIVQPQSINREVDEYTNFTCEAVSFPDPYYQWQRYMDGQFEDIPDANTSILIFSVDFDSYGMYRCVASIPGAVEYSDAALLTVSPRGSVLVMPPVVFKVGGGVATFNCTADGGPNNMFEWLFMDSVVFIGPMYTVYANETTFGDYTCRVSNDAGSGSDTSTLFLSPEGFVRIEQSTFLAYPGETVTFQCIADAGPNNTFIWLFDAADQFCIACSDPQPDNATSYIEYVLSSNMTVTVVGTEPLLEIMSVNASYGGSYQCVVFNDAGFEIVDTSLSVAPLFIVQPQSINREVDEYANFTCEAVSFPDPYYQWQRYMDGQFEDIPDANTSILIFSVDFDSYGMYRCVASIPGAVEYSDSALLTVSPRGSVSVMPPVVFEVGGGVATFNCTADGGPNNMFEWLFMDSVVFIGPMYTVYANETTFGDYTCRVSNDAGSDSDTSTLFLSPEGFVRIEQSTFLAYPGETVTFQCIADAGPNNTFIWLFDAADQFCIACSDPQPDSATSYIKYVLSSNMTVTVVGTEPLLEIMSVNASHGGSYQCVVFNNAGFEIVDTNLYVQPVIELNPVDANFSTAVEPIRLLCSASGFPFPYITWRYNGMDINETVDGDVTILVDNEIGMNSFCRELLTIEDRIGTVSSCLVISDITMSNSGEYMCIAGNGFGNDAESDNATVLVQDIPQIQIGNDSTEILAATSAILSWPPLPVNEGVVLLYQVEYGPTESINENDFNRRKRQVDANVLACLDSLDIQPITVVNTTDTFVNVSNLIPFTVNTFRVRVLTALGFENFSDPISFTVTIFDAPGPVTNLTGIALDTTIISVTWGFPLCPNGIPVNYSISYAQQNITQPLSTDITDVIPIEGPTSTYIIANLIPGLTYAIRVQALTSDVLLGDIEEIFVVALAPLGAVTNLRGSAINSTAMRVQWDASPNTATHYILFYTAGDEPQTVPIDSTGYNISERIPAVNFTTAYIITNLVPGLTYRVHVLPVVIVNDYVVLNGAIDIEIVIPPVRLRPVTNLRAAVLDSQSIVLEWNSPADNILTHYNIHFMPGSIPQTVNISDDGYRRIQIPTQGDANIFVLDGLTHSRQYLVHVQAVIIVDGEVVQAGEVDTELAVLLTNVLTPPTEPPFSVDTSTINVGLYSPIELGITNVTYYGVIVVLDPDPDFDIVVDDFEITYPNLQPYDSRDSDYYITAGWNEDIPNTFVIGDRRTTSAIRNGIMEEYFNAELENGQSYCFYVTAHVQSDIGGNTLIRYAELLCRDTRLGYNRDALISTLVIIGFLLLMLLIVAIVVCCCLCKRRRGKKERVWLVAERANTLTRKPVQDTVVLENIAPLEVDDLSKDPVPVEEFAKYVQTMHKNNGYLLSEEYAHIEPSHTPSISAFNANKPKNRYLNIAAYDHSRVVLEHCPSGSDYINASHIGSYEKSGSFIAAQGPLPNTVGDFWCMVWEQNVSVVAMLTKLEEKDRVKCHQYWPKSPEEENSTDQHGPLTVKYVAELKQEHYTIRTFTLSMPGKESRLVKQYQFTSWPDHGVPIDAFALLEYLDVIRKEYQPSDGPMVVHCSAGVGRTGTFIAIYVQLARIAGEQTVDVYNYVRYLRRQRNLMVQNEKEYVFIYDAIVRAIEQGMVSGEGSSVKEKSGEYSSQSNF